MSLLKRWQETNWYSTLGAKVAVALLATAAAVLVTASTSSAQAPTNTPTATATPTFTATPTANALTQTAVALSNTQTAIALNFTQTAVAATQTALIPTSTATATRTNTATSTTVPTANATQTAAALLTQIVSSTAPSISGTATPPTICNPTIGGNCTVSSAFAGGPTGNAQKVSSFTFNITATAPAGTVANSNPIVFVSTTVGVEGPATNPNLTCSVVSAGLQTTCSGRTFGDILQGAEFRVRFTTPGTAAGTQTGCVVIIAGVPPAGFTDLCGQAFGPGVAGAVVGAIAPVVPPAVVGAGLPFAVPQVGIPAVPRPPLQFIPSAPPPLLPPQAPIQALQGTAMSAAPPRYPEVPVIPESDSLVLVLGGLTALGAVALYRRRR